MKSLVFAAIYLVNSVVSNASPKSGEFNATEFCAERPVGLYCSPESVFQKIECPSEKVFTCPKAPSEFCQERGILKAFGFKGGIARCVPYITPKAIEEFCAEKKQGVYCYGDDDKNIRVQCPSGIIYKCADNPTEDTKKCFQKSSTYATCAIDGGGGDSGKPCTVTTTIATVTATATKTVCENVTVTAFQTKTSIVTTTELQTINKTVTATETKTVTPQCFTSITSVVTWNVTGTPNPVTTTITDIIPTTDLIVSTRTQIQLITRTVLGNSTEVVTSVVTPPPVVSTTTSTTVVTVPVGSTQGTGTVVFPTVTVTKECENKTVTVTTTAAPSTSSSTRVPTATNQNTGKPTIITPTATGEGGEPTVVPPVKNCPSDGSPQTAIGTPPGSDFRYVLTSSRQAESSAFDSCKALGGTLASITTTEDHWWLGQQICEPVWYRTWEGNTYAEPSECIALYPGGATAVPPKACQATLLGLCKIRN